MIRTALPADAGAIVDLAVAADLFTADEAGFLAGVMAEHFAADSDGTCVIDGELRGVAYYRPRPATDRTWELVMLGVHRDHHRRGLGTALLDHVERDLRARGQRLLVVETSALPAFDGARAFYRARGYEEEARIRDYYDVGDDLVVFRRIITPPEQPRPAGSGDLERLLALADASYREDGFATTLSELRRNLHVLIGTDSARVAIAERDGAAVGFAVTTTTFGLGDGTVAELEDLYVEPGHRRRGIAGQLIDDSAAWARERGAAHLAVVIAPDGRDVSHLHTYYEARGFTDGGRRIRSRALRP